VAWMCEALEVSASGYYAWVARADSPAELRRQELVGAIEEIHAAGEQRYGSPRVTAELRSRGRACSENTVAGLMRPQGIRAKSPTRFARTTDSNHRQPVAANILGRDVEPSGPNEAWCADITYVPTREGWLYLAVVEDPFSRVVVGWSMDATMERRPVVDALELALVRRRPGAGLLAHSDRGSRYARAHYPRVLSEEGIVCGMSGVGSVLGQRPGGVALRPPDVRGSHRARCSPPATGRGPNCSSTRTCSTTASAYTPLWGSYPRLSLNGRTTRPTANSVSIFLGDDHVPVVTSVAANRDVVPCRTSSWVPRSTWPGVIGRTSWVRSSDWT